MEAGTSAGQRERAQRSSETESADRLKLAYDSLASHERMQNEAAQRKLDNQEAALELRRQQMEGLQDYRNQRLGQYDTEEGRRQDATESLKDYRNARLDQIDQGLEISKENAENRVKKGDGEFFSDPKAPGQVFYRQPTGHVMKVVGAPKTPSISYKLNDNMTLHGQANDPTMLSAMGTNAPAALVPPPPAEPHLLPPTADNPNALRMGSPRGTLTIGDPTGGAPTSTGTAAADLLSSTTPNSAPSKVTSQEEFDALPSGATYIGEDGKRYRKP